MSKASRKTMYKKANNKTRKQITYNALRHKMRLINLYIDGLWNKADINDNRG